MKVVLVQNQFPDDTHWGGISTFGWFMSRALAKEGAIVHVICQSATEEIETPKIISENITVHRIPGKKSIKGRLKKVLTTILPDKQRWFAHNAWSYFKSNAELMKSDVIDCADYLGCGYYFLKDKTLNKPIVVTCHTPSFLADEMNELTVSKQSDDKRKVYSMEKDSIRKAHGILSPSHRLSQVLSAKTGRQLSDFFTNPYPFPLQQEIQLETISVPVKRPFILFTGRIERRKGIKTLLLAWKNSKWNKEYRLVLAGKYTNHHPEFEKFIEDYQITNLDFLGPQNRAQLSWLYRHTTLTILPSEPFDNYPYTCLESMAYAAPTLVSDSGGMSEIIIHEENGWVFRTKSAEHLTEQLDFILDLPVADRIAIGSKAQQTVKRINASNRIAQRTLNFYQRLFDEFNK